MGLNPQNKLTIETESGPLETLSDHSSQATPGSSPLAKFADMVIKTEQSDENDSSSKEMRISYLD